MMHRFESSVLVPLVQTLLISGGGFLLVKLLARGSTMSGGELLIGPAAVALMLLGLQQTEKLPSKT